MIPEVELSSLPLLSEEAVLTEKLDGANCSIYRGVVSGNCTSMYPSLLVIYNSRASNRRCCVSC